MADLPWGCVNCSCSLRGNEAFAGYISVSIFTNKEFNHIKPDSLKSSWMKWKYAHVCSFSFFGQVSIKISFENIPFDNQNARYFSFWRFSREPDRNWKFCASVPFICAQNKRNFHLRFYFICSKLHSKIWRPSIELFPLNIIMVIHVTAWKKIARSCAKIIKRKQTIF